MRPETHTPGDATAGSSTRTTTRRWRLIVSGAMDGPLNMAIDEALLISAINGGRPAFRIYAWQPPAVSLGYFQQLDDEGIDRAEIKRRGFDLVRRPTGGRAILHKDEVTYSVAARQADIDRGESLMGAYRTISRGLEAGLNRLGVGASLAERTGKAQKSDRANLPTVCFAQPAKVDMVAAGRKIVGSAQVRREDALLQHGAIPIRIDPEEHLAVMPGGLGPNDDPTQAPERLAGAACGVADIIGRAPDFEEFSLGLYEGFADALGIELNLEELTAEERERAETLRATKYATPDWTDHRREPETSSPT